MLTLWLLFIAGAFLLYANSVGIPNFILRPALARVNRGAFAAVIDDAKLDGFSHVRFDRACVYRKKVIGAPMFEADSVRVQLDVMAWIRGRSIVRTLTVDDATWRPAQGRSQEKGAPSKKRRPFEFTAEINNCEVQGITLDCIRFRASGQDQRLQVENLEVSLHRAEKAGRFGGSLAFDLSSRSLSGRLVTNLDPHIVIPLIDPHSMAYPLKLIKRFSFDGPAPRGELVFDRRLDVQGDLHLTGDFRIRDCSYRGVDLLRADGALTIDCRDENYSASMNNLFIVRREGMANVAFSVFPREKRVEFTAESSLEPLAMARMVGILATVTPRHIEIQGASTIEASGVMDVGDQYANTDIRARVQADHIRVHELSCDSGSVDMRMVGRSVTLTNIEASVYGGIGSGNVVLDIPPRGESNCHYRANVSIQNADFERVMQAVRPPKSKNAYQGELSGTLQLEGDSSGDYLKHLKGSGAIHVRDGRVFLLPIFGGLSRFMTKVIPGLDFVLRQSDATSKFEISDGVISTEKVAVEGDILSLKGHGSYVINQELDFDIQVKLMKEHTLVSKLIRVLTYPISKLFEFRVRGTLSEPDWYPVNFSMDLLERVGLKKRERSADKAPEQAEE
jgi:hypothetical protein